MTEQEAREAIVAWAREHFAEDDVEVLHFSCNGDEWEAELAVSGCADNPTVTFREHEHNGVQVLAVEY